MDQTEGTGQKPSDGQVSERVRDFLRTCRKRRSNAFKVVSGESRSPKNRGSFLAKGIWH